MAFNLTNHELRVSSQNFYPGRYNFKKEKTKKTKQKTEMVDYWCNGYACRWRAIKRYHVEVSIEDLQVEARSTGG